MAVVVVEGGGGEEDCYVFGVWCWCGCGWFIFVFGMVMVGASRGGGGRVGQDANGHVRWFGEWSVEGELEEEAGRHIEMNISCNCGYG